ncbi:MAG: tripartite tricarboxylate transporter substrate binding protein [Burkholderiales bacterium]|nr:tripartite tricarboxylate transporter substrate binding protein [Burkholderiales bacterium]
MLTRTYALMSHTRRLFPGISLSWAPVLCAAVVALAAPQVAAQPAFPTKSIRFLVGAPPGGSNDLFARAVGQRLHETLGQPVVVDNRPGANQMIAADIMAKSPPDGHTIYITSTSFTTGAALQPKLPFDPVNDITGITMLGNGPLVFVVHPALPAKTMKELIALARARPGQLNFTSSGIGGINHLGTEVFMAAAKLKMVHIPHKGMGPALTDLISGQVQVLLVSLPSVSPQMKAGRLRALAVSTAKRTTFMPELPTVAESGVPGYDVSLWWGVFAPARTPKPVIDRLNAEIRKALATDAMKKHFADFGAEPSPMTPEAFSATVKSEIAKWSKVIRDANIKPE